jgi:hypothetical protein
MAKVYKDRRSDIVHAWHYTYSQSHIQTNDKIGLKTLNKFQKPYMFRQCGTILRESQI